MSTVYHGFGKDDADQAPGNFGWTMQKIWAGQGPCIRKGKAFLEAGRRATTVGLGEISEAQLPGSFRVKSGTTLGNGLRAPIKWRCPLCGASVRPGRA
jgi:hypothetical protein